MVSDLDEHKSTFGHTFLLNNGIISWKSKKQTCTTLSTMKAEFIVCSVAVKEVVWLRGFLQNLGIVKDVFRPTKVYNNIQAMITYVKDLK